MNLTFLCYALLWETFKSRREIEEESNAHFYDGRFGLKHPFSDHLSDPLLPGERSFVLVSSLLLAALLLGLHLSRIKGERFVVVLDW